jgi:hypothetical protein
MLFKLYFSLIDDRSGRLCRRCGAPIPSEDHFGVAESVCASCRR